MKTFKTYRNAALMLPAAFFLMSMIIADTPADGVSANADRAEFSGAGYWIDPVVVTPGSDNTLDGTGYWIDPVVVTWSAKNEFARAGYWIDPVVVTSHAVSPAAESPVLTATGAEEVTQQNTPGYWIDPVIVTYCRADRNKTPNTSGDLAMN